MSSPIFLSRRSVVEVNGPEAEPFLNGLLTCATLGLAPGETRWGALLTPQGKIAVETLLTRSEDGFLIDCDVGAAPVLLRKLTLYRMRAAVSLAPRQDLGVVVFARSDDRTAHDPRSPLAPRRGLASMASMPLIETRPADLCAYHAARIAALVPEQGADFGVDEVFPADVNMDLGTGVDFRKGCYVGQEVVSRMKRRGTARRRTLRVELSGDVRPPAPIVAADGAEVGVLTSREGAFGLARVRIDRLPPHGEGLTSGGAPVALVRPDWLAEEIAALAAAKEGRA
jgi:hypothetical protein